MTQGTQQTFTFAGLDDYTPWEGGAHGMVSHEGIYLVEVTNVTCARAKSGDKEFFVVQQTVLDEDNKGIPLISRQHYYGMGKTKDKKTGAEVPYNMAKQAADLAVSAGALTVEQIQAFAKAKQQLPVEQLRAVLLGKKCAVKVTFDLNPDGQLVSEVDSYLAPEVYKRLAEQPSMLRGVKASEELRQTKLAAAQRGALGGAGLPPSLPSAMPALTFGNGAAAPAAAGAPAPFKAFSV